MSFRCFAVDDENHALSVISGYITSTPGLILEGTENDPLQAMVMINGGKVRPNIVFLDIDMPKLSGLQLAELIGNRALVIFTTAFADYAVQAFEQEAVDYILKPFSYDRFLKAVERAKERLRAGTGKTAKEDPFFFIKTDLKGRYAQIPVDEVDYIHADGNYIQIHLSDRMYQTYLSITEISERLSPDQFIRCHRSYIVNIAKVKLVESSTITLKSGQTVPVGSTFRPGVLQKVEENLFDRPQP